MEPLVAHFYICSAMVNLSFESILHGQGDSLRNSATLNLSSAPETFPSWTFLLMIRFFSELCFL